MKSGHGFSIELKKTEKNKFLFAFLQTKGIVGNAAAAAIKRNAEFEEESPKKKDKKNEEEEKKKEEVKAEEIDPVEEEENDSQNSFRSRIYRNIESPSIEPTIKGSDEGSGSDLGLSDSDVSNMQGMNVAPDGAAKAKRKKAKEMQTFFCLDV